MPKNFTNQTSDTTIKLFDVCPQCAFTVKEPLKVDLQAKYDNSSNYFHSIRIDKMLLGIVYITLDHKKL